MQFANAKTRTHFQLMNISRLCDFFSNRISFPDGFILEIDTRPPFYRPISSMSHHGTNERPLKIDGGREGLGVGGCVCAFGETPESCNLL